MAKVLGRQDSSRAGERLTVLVADDHPVYRDGLAREFLREPGFELVASVSGGHEALEAIRRIRPRVAILDLRLPDLDGMAVLEAVEAERLPTGVVVLSAFGDSATVYDAFSRGARAFLLKASTSGEIFEAVRTVARGESVIPIAFQTGLTREIQSRRALVDRPLLSPREVQVLRLVAEGRSASEIGDELSLTVATVKSHLQRIYEKLEVSDRAAAVAVAMRRGLLR
ncbi:response regulator transcription factor [Pseudonocardia asaccharolytica]|uniref:DNA-binding response regulator n=1 Tax=Pseudonocardia asaccharolytica DSM 44247 = NBRC 16224 TaxID=1123024 RepID=A0A511D500_9PSEU|nr:response regulator transcription factor [Pseudonocardia asaccharolytica]GEL19876.1 DNA-binding response regulator [Pseudonocardia asaccharolytica DSM 44247 = NBRC 16224]